MIQLTKQSIEGPPRRVVIFGSVVVGKISAVVTTESLWPGRLVYWESADCIRYSTCNLGHSGHLEMAKKIGDLQSI